MKAENTSFFPCFVADTSFMAAYLLNGFCDDEMTDCIKDIEYVLKNNGQIYVPPLFWYEIENVLLYKTRSKKDGQLRLTTTDVMDIMYDLNCLPHKYRPSPRRRNPPANLRHSPGTRSFLLRCQLSRAGSPLQSSP